MPIAFQYDWPERPGQLPEYRCLTMSFDRLDAPLEQQVRQELAKAGCGDEERDFQVTRYKGKVIFHLLRALPFKNCRDLVDTIEHHVATLNTM